MFKHPHVTFKTQQQTQDSSKNTQASISFNINHNHGICSEHTCDMNDSRKASHGRSPYLLPARLYRRPPSPRTASEIRKARPVSGLPVKAGAQKAVGWNWTNSMLAMAACARYAMAMPSPVATPGLVVIGYTYTFTCVSISSICLCHS